MQSYNKFFHNIMNAPIYGELLADNQVVFHGQEVEDDENDIVSISVDVDLDDNLRHLRHSEPLNRNVNFSGAMFLAELYSAFYEHKVEEAKNAGNDTEYLESIIRQKDELRDQLGSMEVDLTDKGNEISRLKTELDKVKKSRDKVIREKEKSDKDLLAGNEEIQKIKDESEKKLAEMELRLKANEDLYDYNDALVKKSLDAFKLYGDNEKENYIKWVRNYYSNTIILHNKAIESIDRDKVPRDWKSICEATHYLSCYVRVMSKGNIGSDEASKVANMYCRQLKGFQVTGCMSESTKNMYGEKYLIDISDLYPLEKNKQVYLDKHIKIGVDSEKLVRIYVHYDGVLKKAIIGYMPDHLPTSSY